MQPRAESNVCHNEQSPSLCSPLLSCPHLSAGAGWQKSEGWQPLHFSLRKPWKARSERHVRSTRGRSAGEKRINRAPPTSRSTLVFLM